MAGDHDVSHASSKCDFLLEIRMAKLEVSYFVIKPIVSMPSPGLT